MKTTKILTLMLLFIATAFVNKVNAQESKTYYYAFAAVNQTPGQGWGNTLMHKKTRSIELKCKPSWNQLNGVILDYLRQLNPEFDEFFMLPFHKLSEDKNEVDSWRVEFKNNHKVVSDLYNLKNKFDHLLNDSCKY